MTQNPRQSKSSAGPKNRAVYFRLLRYARPYRARLVLGVLCGMLFGGSTMGILGAFRENIANIFDPAGLPLSVLIGVAALLPGFALLRGIGDFASRYLVNWVGQRVVMDLRDDTFRHIHRLSVLYFTRSRTGELVSRATNDTMMIERAVSHVIGDLAREPFVMLGAVVYLFWLDWRLAVLSLVVFPVCIVPVAMFGRRVRRAARQAQECLADLVSILHETVGGVRVVKAFGMEEYEKERFRDRNRAVFNRLMRVARARAAVEPVIVTISFIGLSLALLYARWAAMTYAEFFTFAASLVVLYQPAKRISRLHLQISQSCAAGARIFEILDTEPDVVDRPKAIPFDGQLQQVRFENVSFAYEQEMVLQEINLTAHAGQRIAIVGSSGAGKTTLVSLLPRFFDVTGGRILFDDVDIRDLNIDSLRRRIGIVTQETVLFNDTVANNIAYGQKAADRSAIEEAASRAYADEFIRAMPAGYDTIVGERGVRLSGGQSQRLAIARAMLRNPPILILDEATSALDTESERKVQAALDSLMTDRTVFAIAHRLSTIIKADLILVLDRGRVVEQGRHEDLLALDGAYRRLYDMQFENH